jgi:signal transduction histidine kinase
VKSEQVWARLMDGARQLLQADAAAVRLLRTGQGDSANLTVVTTIDPVAALDQSEQIELADSPLDQLALSGQPAIVSDTKTDPQATNVPGDYRSVLCVPMVHEGKPIGTLHVYASAPGRFCEQDIAPLMSLVDLGTAAAEATNAAMALQSQETRKAHFIHVATHELRSPVAVSQSLVRGVLKGYAGEMTDQQAEIFGRVSRRLDFLESLVNDLLDLAAGKAADKEEATAVVLNSSVGRTVLLLQPRAEEKGVNLVHRACCEELVVRGTEEGLDRIFVNLVGNAIKYTPSGGNVTVALRRVKEDIEVQVIDNGIGIPEQALPHLFEEFYRAPNAKALNEVGTGLGLAIVKDLADQYGASIEVESTVGQGTTFTLTFPVLHLNGVETTCRLPDRARV